jgi:fumarate hydratase class II
VVKIGRTHLMDAVPLTVGQEWSGWAHQIHDAQARICASEGELFEPAAAALASGDIDNKRFDEIVDPKEMIGHGVDGR